MRNEIIQRLVNGPDTSPAIAQALDTSEAEVLALLDEMRRRREVEFAGGEWSLTDSFKAILSKKTL